jgi:hypothetical protein
MPCTGDGDAGWGTMRLQPTTGERRRPANVIRLAIGNGLIAPRGVDPLAVVADTPADVRGRRWVVRHGPVVGRRRNLRRNRVGDVRAATHRYPSAAAHTHVGVCDPGGVNSDDRPADGREGEDARRTQARTSRCMPGRRRASRCGPDRLHRILASGDVEPTHAQAVHLLVTAGPRGDSSSMSSTTPFTRLAKTALTLLQSSCSAGQTNDDRRQ